MYRQKRMERKGNTRLWTNDFNTGGGQLRRGGKKEMDNLRSLRFARLHGEREGKKGLETQLNGGGGQGKEKGPEGMFVFEVPFDKIPYGQSQAKTGLWSAYAL